LGGRRTPTKESTPFNVKSRKRGGSQASITKGNRNWGTKENWIREIITKEARMYLRAGMEEKSTNLLGGEGGNIRFLASKCEYLCAEKILSQLATEEGKKRKWKVKGTAAG